MVICSANILIVQTILIIFYKRGQLNTFSEKRQKSCEVAFIDLNFEIRGYWAILYPLFQKLRFMLLVYVTLYLYDYLYL